LPPPEVEEMITDRDPEVTCGASTQGVRGRSGQIVPQVYCTSAVLNHTDPLKFKVGEFDTEKEQDREECSGGLGDTVDDEFLWTSENFVDSE
ncbi:hypothetical protein STEG23_030766, partial [Scotinomys teguina]